MFHIMTHRLYPVLLRRIFLIISSMLRFKRKVMKCVLIFLYVYLKNLIARKIHRDIIVNALR